MFFLLIAAITTYFSMSELVSHAFRPSALWNIRNFGIPVARGDSYRVAGSLATTFCFAAWRCCCAILLRRRGRDTPREQAYMLRKTVRDQKSISAFKQAFSASN